MDRGLYEHVFTTSLQKRLAATGGYQADIRDLVADEQPHVLAAFVAREVEARLRRTTDPNTRAHLINQVLELTESEDAVVEPIQRLLRVDQPAGPGVVRYPDARPRTPLAEAALLTNAHGEPNLGSELRDEIDTADHVDLLCAFVRWTGLRLLEAPLRRLRERGGQLRVITTTYLGSTERAALDRLIDDFGADVRVQYDAQRTRLHAKAWLFHRNTGLHTAYVGSSNLSNVALLEGVEWNVRLSTMANPSLVEKFRATFSTYWNGEAYEPYVATDAKRLDAALAAARGADRTERATLQLSGLDVTPLPHQRRMLDEIHAERVVHGRHRNLVVAATGTGKTVLAALDYKRLVAQNNGERPRLLFVAHRSEILEQARRTYREVLGDGGFGELFVGGARPSEWRFVFASIQSLSSWGVDNIGADAFEVVVIDEFHHAAAASYQKLLSRLKPKELLGLTATPERADGIDVRSLFDGRLASELRLWDALGADLLCPFHYFAVADHTDLSRVQWTRGRYDEGELGRLYTGNTARANLVLREIRSKVPDPAAMRALGYCVSVDHAHFMAQHFRDAGIPAIAVSGETLAQERERVLRQLRTGEVNVIFSVDLFNEGLDIPDIDTVLFLRPTESATVFLQQLGRGLRRTSTKPVLTAFDFVGHQRKEFRFDRKLRALTGTTRRGLEREIEREFPFLPAGCQIVMDRQAQEAVLTNVRQQLTRHWPQMVGEARAVADAVGDPSLGDYLHETGIELSDVVRRQGDRSWTRLRREAHLPVRDGSEGERHLLRRAQAFAHVEDPDRALAYRSILGDNATAYDQLSPAEQTFARMLFFSLYPNAGGFASYDGGLSSLREEPAARDEIRSVVDVAFEQGRVTPSPLDGDLSEVPLRVHARYQREEILAGLDYANLERSPRSHMTGVAYSDAWNADILLITLNKAEADYSPTTMYRDYPISPTLFHWESQSTTSLRSPQGQRYVNGTSHVLLFVRQEARGDFDTNPYTFLGPATYVSHEGERPIAITWRLRTPMPTELFEAASAVAS